MKYELIFRTEAKTDLEDIQDYYHNILPSYLLSLFKL